MGEDNKARTKPDEALPPVSSLHDLLPYEMNRLLNRLNQNLGKRLRAIGLTFPYWRVLAVLAVRDMRTITELVDYTIIPQSTLSRVLDRMERDGLISRRSSSQDTRVVEIRTTARGRKLYHQALPLAEAEYHGAIVHFTEQDVRILRHAVHRMMRNADLALTIE